MRGLDAPHMRQKLDARGTGPHLAPGPFDQPQPEPQFELAHLLADRRLRQVQTLGGGRKTAELDDIGEGAQLVGIEEAQSKNLLMVSIIKQDFSYDNRERSLSLFPHGRRNMTHETGPNDAALRIEDAAETDLGAVTAIYAHHVQHGLASFEEEAPSSAEMRRRFTELKERGFPYLVARLDGDVVGYAYASPYRARSAYRFSIENSVYVAPGFARRGIGSALLGTLIARCERGEWRQMIAIIGDSDNAASIALHRAHGFRLVGTLHSVGFKHGRFVDTVLMQRELGDGGDMSPGAAIPP
jgi:phosphinothricin acetyltransferase